MTAINAFQDGQFAYLACDSAYVDYDGKVVMLGFKMFAFKEHRMAVALSGAGLLPEILTGVTSDLILDQNDLLKSLQTHFLQARQAAVGKRAQLEEAGLNDITMIAACFYKPETRPALFRIASSDSTLPGSPVNQWHEVDGLHFPGEIPARIQQKGYVDDPIIDGRALFRAQRNHTFPGIAGGRGVGGTCSIFCIGSNTFDGWDILDFSDRVGEQINMFDQGVDVLRPIQTMIVS